MRWAWWHHRDAGLNRDSGIHPDAAAVDSGVRADGGRADSGIRADAGAVLDGGGVADIGVASGDGGAWRPFAADSPWNTPIAASPAIDPGSTSMINALATSSQWAYLDVAIAQYSVPIYWVDSAALPLLPVTISRVAGYGFHSDARAPLPPGAAPAAGGDRHLALIDRRTHWEWDFWHAANSGGAWTCDVCAQIDTNGRGVRPYPEQTIPDWWDAHGARACGFPLSAGLITVEEMQAGRIDHALVIGYPGIRSRYFTDPASTAQATFGSLSQISGIPCGGRIQLDPTLDVDALPLSAGAKIIARALQRYGAYVGDFNGSIALYADSSPDAQAAWSTGLLRTADLRSLDLHRFRVLQIGTLFDDHN